MHFSALCLKQGDKSALEELRDFRVKYIFCGLGEVRVGFSWGWFDMVGVLGHGHIRKDTGTLILELTENQTMSVNIK